MIMRYFGQENSIRSAGWHQKCYPIWKAAVENGFTILLPEIALKYVQKADLDFQI